MVTVSGDGGLFEVINGLYSRVDWPSVSDTIRVGIVPGGSGQRKCEEMIMILHIMLLSRSRCPLLNTASSKGKVLLRAAGICSESGTRKQSAARYCGMSDQKQEVHLRVWSGLGSHT